MIFARKSIFFAVLALLLAGIYGVVVFADEFTGGYTPGESLDPTCAPNTSDCFVKTLVGLTSTDNTFLGVDAGNDTMTGINNTFIGENAGVSNTTGSNNVFLGMSTGMLNDTGTDNTFTGAGAGGPNTSGNSNTFFGNVAGGDNTTGSFNAFFGKQAGNNNATGSNNVFLGYQAGASNVSGSNNIAIGYGVDVLSATEDNQLFIGSLIIGDMSDLTLGMGDVFDVGNSTSLVIDDLNSAVQIMVADNFHVIDTSFNENEWFKVDVADTTTSIGDIDTGMSGGNGTLFTVNDFDQTIIASADASGTGGRMGISATSAGFQYSDGAGVWSFFADDTGGGSLGIQDGTDIWTWPSGFGNPGEALVDIDGLGTLDWAPVGDDCGSGTCFTQTGGPLYNMFAGTGAGTAITTGSQNFFAGTFAGQSTSTGDTNTFVGQQSGSLNTTGQANTFLGYQSGYSNTEGYINTFIGAGAGFGNTTGAGNTFVGRNAAQNSISGNNNTALGYNNAAMLTTGAQNIIIGNTADVAGPSVTYAIALGYGAIADSNEFALPASIDYWKFNGTSYDLPDAFPAASGYALVSTDTGGMSWAAVASGNVTGSGTSTRIPYWSSVTALTDDSSFTRLAARGVQLQDDSTFKNVFIGTTTGVVGATGSANVAVGVNTLNALTSGRQNVAFGEDAGGNTADGIHNVTIGNMAGFENVSAQNSVFIGREAGRRMRADESIAIGYGAMFGSGTPANNTGQRNIALGRDTLSSLTSGQNNIAIGYGSGTSIANGAENILIGQTTGSSIVATSGNTFIGNANSTGRTSGNNNTFVGAAGGGAAATGATNAGLGYNVLSVLTSGANNVAVGAGAGTTLTTGSDNTFVGQSTAAAATGTTGAIALGYQATAATNEFSISDTITKWKFQGDSYTLPTAFPGVNDYALTATTTGVMSWTDVAAIGSDEQLKSNITDLPTDILSKLLNVRTVSYTLNSDKSNKTRIGFLAQDLEQYFPELVTTREDGYKAVYYAQMSSVLTKAIQEMDLKITGLQNLTDETFLGKLREWFASAANGIESLFVREVHTEKICVKKSDGSEICVTGDELEDALEGDGSGSGGSTGESFTGDGVGESSGDDTSGGDSSGTDGSGGTTGSGDTTTGGGTGTEGSLGTGEGGVGGSDSGGEGVTGGESSSGGDTSGTGGGVEGSTTDGGTDSGGGSIGSSGGDGGTLGE